MAFKRSTSTLLLAVLWLLIIHDQMEVYDGRNYLVAAEQIDCMEKCEYRCSKSSRHKICMRACNTCCQRCNCVPPGTSGNKQVCPCYNNMTTHGGRPKCP